MRDPKRIDAIQNKIKTVWEEYPDMRYFQFVSYLAELVCKNSDFSGDFFFLEDNKLEEALDKIIAKERSNEIIDK